MTLRYQRQIPCTWHTSISEVEVPTVNASQCTGSETAYLHRFLVPQVVGMSYIIILTYMGCSLSKIMEDSVMSRLQKIVPVCALGAKAHSKNNCLSNNCVHHVGCARSNFNEKEPHLHTKEQFVFISSFPWALSPVFLKRINL